MTCRCKSWN